MKTSTIEIGNMVSTLSPRRRRRRQSTADKMRKSPLRRAVDACEVGRAALLLASDYTSDITGEVLHVDAGFHVSGMVFR